MTVTFTVNHKFEKIYFKSIRPQISAILSELTEDLFRLNSRYDASKIPEATHLKIRKK